MADQKTAVRCKIARGGFSAERVFEIKLADGSEHIGVCLREYCMNDGGALVGEDQPSRGETLSGRVEARVLKENGAALVHLPDGEVVEVEPSLVVVATISSAPDVEIKIAQSATAGQQHV